MTTNSGVPLSELKNNILSGFADFIDGQDESIADIRRKAMDAFDRQGFPTVKSEEWKYTNLSKFLNDEWVSRVSSTLSESIGLEAITLPLETHRLIFADGKYREDLSRILPGEEPIIISTFANAIKNHPDLVRQWYGRNVPADANGMTALNTAMAKLGCFIYIPKGIKTKYPVQLVFASGTTGEKLLTHIRNLVILEEGASLDLIENYISTGHHEVLSNMVSEIVVQHGALLNHYRFQAENDATASLVNFTGISQQSHSLVNNFTISTGGKLVRNDLNYRLEGKGCESHMFGLYIGDGNQHIDNHTLMDHAMPDSFSNEFYKGIMGGKSTGVFNGKVIVRKDAQKTNAYQSNKNILLSDEAHINTKPQLEIFANDVKCSHGATTGQLDEEALFYLRSRGIGAAEAKAMLTVAFAADVLENIKNDDLKAFANQLVTDKLNLISTE
jgi:Fe-S cluster assembly protein SufD